MSSNTTQVVSGSFISTGAPINIVIPSGANWFELLDATQAAAATASSTSAMVSARWSADMPAGAAYTEIGNGGTPSLLQPNYITTGGFTPYAMTGPEQVGPLLTGSVITAATPAVGTVTNTYVAGQVVRILNSVGMEQISGWDFTVTVATSSHITLGYLAAVGFAADASAFKVCLVNPLSSWYPQYRLITGITQAAQCVVTLSVTHNFQVGQLVRVKCPNAFGMGQIAGQVGQILAINTSTNTVTLNINTTGYTAFAFPTSVIAAEGDQWPMLVPIGEFPNTTNLVPFDNTGTQGLTLGTAVCGATSDQMYWTASTGVLLN